MTQIKSKVGVFISHITDEKAVANKLKSLIRQAFGKDFSVFVSSDYISIPGGDPWFTRIVDSLKSVQIVIVLISNQSVDRRWVNFEAGVGIGSEAKVIPVVFRNFEKGDVGVPLAELQIRNLHDPKDVSGLIGDITNQIGAQPRQIDEELFVEELNDIEKTLPTKEVSLEPFIDYPNQDYFNLNFKLVNTGNRDVELIELWAAIPDGLRLPNWTPQPVPPARYVEQETINGNLYVGYKYLAGVEPARTGYYRSDFVVLPRHMSSGMFPFTVKELRFAVKRTLNDEEKAEIIRFKVHARGGSSFGEIALKDIEGFQG